MNPHKYFTKSERKHAKAKHEQFKRNQPRMFKEQRDEFVRAIIDAKEVNLNIGKVSLI